MKILTTTCTCTEQASTSVYSMKKQIQSGGGGGHYAHLPFVHSIKKYHALIGSNTSTSSQLTRGNSIFIWTMAKNLSSIFCSRAVEELSHLNLKSFPYVVCFECTKVATVEPIQLSFLTGFDGVVPQPHQLVRPVTPTQPSILKTFVDSTVGNASNSRVEGCKKDLLHWTSCEVVCLEDLIS